MDLPALAAAAEKWYGIDLSDADPTVLQTVNEFVAYLNGKLP
jgi:acyl carrier protein